MAEFWNLTGHQRGGGRGRRPAGPAGPRGGVGGPAGQRRAAAAGPGARGHPRRPAAGRRRPADRRHRLGDGPVRPPVLGLRPGRVGHRAVAAPAARLQRAAGARLARGTRSAVGSTPTPARWRPPSASGRRSACSTIPATPPSSAPRGTPRAAGTVTGRHIMTGTSRQGSGNSRRDNRRKARRGWLRSKPGPGCRAEPPRQHHKNPSLTQLGKRANALPPAQDPAQDGHVAAFSAGRMRLLRPPEPPRETRSR